MKPDTPTFNLKAVVQETGIKPDTLRAWERRYGLPEPQRSPGGHRIYSQQDIDTLLWLLARQKEGLTISRAVDLWRSIEAEGRDPLRASEYATQGTRHREFLLDGAELHAIRKQWLTACLAFDERTAQRCLAQALALYPVETVCGDVLQRGLREVGEGWRRGEITVHQEHFTTALAMRRVGTMLETAPAPTRPGRIFLACPPGERHVFGLALLQLLLRRRGFDTVYLGGDVPLERLEASLDQVRPSLVLLTAQQLHTAASLMEMAAVAAAGEAPVGYGGRIFSRMPSVRGRISGHYLGDALAQACEGVEELIRVPPPTPEVAPLPPEYRKALSCFQTQITAVQARVEQALSNMRGQPSPLASAPLSLTRDIVAALKLGDIALIGSNLAGARRLLRNHGLSMEALGPFLRAYRQAVHEQLGADAAPILQGLDRLAQQMRDRVPDLDG